MVYIAIYMYLSELCSLFKDLDKSLIHPSSSRPVDIICPCSLRAISPSSMLDKHCNERERRMQSSSRLLMNCEHTNSGGSCMSHNVETEWMSCCTEYAGRAVPISTSPSLYKRIESNNYHPVVTRVQIFFAMFLVSHWASYNNYCLSKTNKLLHVYKKDWFGKSFEPTVNNNFNTKNYFVLWLFETATILQVSVSVSATIATPCWTGSSTIEYCMRKNYHSK